METPYCLFEIDRCHSAVEATYVEEVFALPELVLIPNAPLGVIGVIDLRGDTLPIVDFRLETETQPRSYQLTDSIVVLNQADLRIGVVVNSVKGIRELSAQGTTTALNERPELSNLDANRFFAGMASDQTDIFILSSPQAWFNPGEIQQVISVTRFLVSDFYDSRADREQSGAQSSEDPGMMFAPTATREERAAFRQRAESLRQSLSEERSITDSRSLITVALDNNIFGIDSSFVREFITINQATPIPCCPKHIIGNMNLRGEILTIVDVSKSLGLSLKSLPRKPKAVVLEFEDTLTVVIVEEVRDALFTVNPTDVKTVSDRNFAMRHTYIQGEAPYRDQMMYILDMPKLLSSNELVVNEIL
ncbi:MAG: chemotaxis protein CheW [Cyanobacteria bacterium P01_H01_bin.26]